MKEAIIRNIPLFGELPDNEIAYLAENLSQVDIASGTVIFREGEPGDYLLVVLLGELEIVKEIERDLDFLSATVRDLPARQADSAGRVLQKIQD